jgi:hypothetical protein
LREISRCSEFVPAGGFEAGEPMGNARVVYTAITAGYDPLKPPVVVDADLDYVVFTDDPALEAVEPWRPVLIDIRKRNPRVTSRWYKLLPHLHFPDHEHSLWIDGTFEIVSSLSPLLDRLSTTGDIAAFRHPERDCIYKEALAVKELGYERPAIVDLQMACYRARGYPAENGLHVCGVLFRRHHDPALRRAMEDWWRQLELFSQRDQLSFNYVLWKHGITCGQVSDDQRPDGWLRRYDHPLFRTHLEAEEAHDELAWLRAAAADAFERQGGLGAAPPVGAAGAVSS